MITIKNVTPLHKGALLGTCDVHIEPWKITMHDVKIFEKGANRWISLPSRSIIADTGETKYIEMISFDSKAIKDRFQAQIMAVVDEFLAVNPEMKADDVVKPDEEYPF